MIFFFSFLFRIEKCKCKIHDTKKGGTVTSAVWANVCLMKKKEPMWHEMLIFFGLCCAILASCMRIVNPYAASPFRVVYKLLKDEPIEKALYRPNCINPEQGLHIYTFAEVTEHS